MVKNQHGGLRLSLKAAYGHGWRIGRFCTPRAFPTVISIVKATPTPHWMPTRLHRYVWRQGLRDGAGVPTLISTLTLLLIGE